MGIGSTVLGAWRWGNIPLKIITINLPLKVVEAIELLRDLGLYPSKSEFLRSAIREFLEEELRFDLELDPILFKSIIKGGKIYGK